MPADKVKVICRIANIHNKHNGSNTWKEGKIIIPTGQGSIKPETRVLLDQFDEGQITLNATLTASQKPLFPEIPDEEDGDQGKMELE